MEAATSDERRRLLSGYSVEYGIIGNNQSTQNIRDINYNINQLKTEHQPLTLKEALRFPEMADREHCVAEAHGETGRWFLRTREYLAWEGSEQLATKSRRCCGLLPARAAIQRDLWQHRLLWVKGNAGAGKSTLLKMAVEYGRETYADALILPHFFNARGTLLERSTEGLYRTLICWLLQQLPAGFEVEIDPRSIYKDTRKWEVPELVRLLKAAIRRLADRPVIFYVDALDECEQQQVGDMLEVFRTLVEAAWKDGREVRVLFASRPYPHHTFKHATFIDLGQQEEHGNDIAEYVKDRLNDGVSLAIQERVRKKASGVFMWVVLVVDMLNKKYDDGDVDELEALLDRVPAGLHALYNHILERFPEDLDAMLEVFRWLLFKQGELNAHELWWAVQLSLGRSDADIRRDYELRNEADMRRYIVRVGKGLVDLYISKERQYPEETAYPQFIHESVREFIMDKEAGVLKMYGVQSREDLEAQSRQRLRDSFLSEVMARREQLVEFVRETEQKALTEAVLAEMGWQDRRGNPRLPLARFAATEMIMQAEDAQQSGFDQTAFLHSLIERVGPYFLIVPDCSVFFSAGYWGLVVGSVIGMLMRLNCRALLQATQMEACRLALHNGQPFGLVEEGSKWSPFAGAMNGSMAELSDTLVDMYLLAQPRPPELQQILQHLASGWKKRSEDRPVVGRPQYGPLLDVARSAPQLGIFFLVALAPQRALEPHFAALQQLVDKSSASPGWFLAFTHTLHLFVREQVPSSAIDLMHPDTVRWLESLEAPESHRDEEGVVKPGWRNELSQSEREEWEEERQIRQRILALLAARHS